MAEKVTLTNKEKKIAKELATSMLALAGIVTATNEGGFAYTSAEIHKPLVEAGLVEVNSSLVNEAGEMATRATEKAISAGIQGEATGEALEEIAAPAPPVRPTFALESGVAIPHIAKGGAIRKSAYPFDAMGEPTKGEDGSLSYVSFFVPATEGKPDPAKSLASTVSGATRKYSTPKLDENGAQIMRVNRKKHSVPVQVASREFTIRAVEENGVKGARIFRVK